jgi:hypothetical protein
MITLIDWLELAGHRITDSSDYLWHCYGSDVISMSSWRDMDNYEMSIVYSKLDQTVFEVSICDYRNDRAYRIINTDYVKKYRKEAKKRDCNPNQAWDNVNYIDLETDDDFIQKALAIVAGEEYDTSIVVPLDLSDDELFVLMKLAHKADITFNQYIEHAITVVLDKCDDDPKYRKKLKKQYKKISKHESCLKLQ